MFGYLNLKSCLTEWLCLGTKRHDGCVGFEQEFGGTNVPKIPNALWPLHTPEVGGGDYMEVSLHTVLWEFAPHSVWDQGTSKLNLLEPQS